MAELTIISETGMFHSACRCKFQNNIEWYGFKPRQHRAPAGHGFVDRSDRSNFINHYVSFDINDAVLRVALKNVSVSYENSIYAVTVRDCVSFTADVARQSRLRVPAFNLTPYGLIEILAVWNRYTAKK